MNEIKAMMWKDMRYILRKKLLLYMTAVVVYMVVANTLFFAKGKNSNLGVIFNFLFLSFIAVI